MDVGIIGSRGYPVVYSGYETLVSALAPALASRGHEVTVYCHRHCFAERPSTCDGVKLRYARGLAGKTVVQLSHSAYATAMALMARHDAVLFLNVANAPFAALLSSMGVPCAINVDGLEWRRPKWSSIGRGYFRFAARLASHSVPCVITDAEEMRRVYRSEFSARSEMIAYGAPGGLSPDWAALDRWGLRRREYYLLMGRLIPDNNGELLAAEFVRSQSRRKLVVLGDVPYRGDAYASRIRDTYASDRMIFTGYVSEPRAVQALLEGSFGYLHGHEFGGTNPSLLWAMSAGCRILALDTPFAREVMGTAVQRGLFTKERGSLAKAIAALEGDEASWEESVGNAMERVSEVYSWDSIVTQYEEVLARLAFGGGVR